MIGPGWLPRPVSRLRKRTLAYTRVRPRSYRRGKVGVKPEPAAHNETVGEFQIWPSSHHPAEFPLAIARPHEPGARAIAMLGDLRRWLAARWAWFKPRTVPVIVAAVGMIFVLLSADYLAHAHGDAPAKSDLLIVRVR